MATQRDGESVSSVTNEILKDVALTNKLLRLVNSAHYARGGNISTVSQCSASLVGFNGIRNMALSLVLLEHMQDKAHAAQLKEEFLRSLMAGTHVGSELCSVPRDRRRGISGRDVPESGPFAGAVLFSGRSHATVRSRMTQSAARAGFRRKRLLPSAVLGLTYEELGPGRGQKHGVCQSGIQRCMRKPDRCAAAQSGRLCRCARAASAGWLWRRMRLPTYCLHSNPKDVDRYTSRQSGQAQIRACATGAVRQRNSSCQATAKARQKLVELAVAMEIRVARPIQLRPSC